MTVSQQAIDAAAKAIRNAVKATKLDGGGWPLPLDTVATAALEAGAPFMVAGCYICQPENPNAAEEGCDHCDAEASMYRHAEVLRTQLAALTAQLQTVRVATIRECVEAVTWRGGTDVLFPGVNEATAILRALLDATPATTAGEDDGVGFANDEMEAAYVVQPDAAATCGHTFHYWHDGVRYWSQGEHHSTRFPCPASTDDGTGT